MISPNSTPSETSFRTTYLPWAIAVLFIFYAVGFWGLGFSAYKPYFMALVPFNLLLTNVLLFLFHRGWNRAFFLFAGLAWLVGMAFEWVGVHTGLMFGEYIYGPTLGPHLWGVPVLIGANWLMLVYSSGHAVQKVSNNWLVQAVLGAAAMVLLDFFIEPVAVRYDFWAWQEEVIPFSNFIGWFVVAFLLHVYFQKAPLKRDNPMAPYVFLVQLLFFIGLYLAL